MKEGGNASLEGEIPHCEKILCSNGSLDMRISEQGRTIGTLAGSGQTPSGKSGG